MPRRGKAWTIQDRYGDWVYLTWERWRHILAHHPSMGLFFDEIRQTVKRGRRKQDTLNSAKYFYREWFDNLPNGHNTVVVVVGVNPVTDDRFVLTAYPDYRPRP